METIFFQGSKFLFTGKEKFLAIKEKSPTQFWPPGARKAYKTHGFPTILASRALSPTDLQLKILTKPEGTYKKIETATVW